MIWIVLAALVVLALVAITVTLLRVMGSEGDCLPVTAEWIGDLSSDRYKPMMRLLDSSDIAFLRSQPGYTPKIEATLRVQRCQVFRGYLRCLRSDFSRVCMALKIVMSQSGNDRSDLASVLLHQQMMFACGLLVVQARLILYRWGICDVEVAGLVRIFDNLRAELCTLVPTIPDLA